MTHLIDLTTGENVTEHAVKSRLMQLTPGTVYNRVDHLSSAELGNIDVGTYTETEPPAVEHPYTIIEGEIDKTDPLNWVQTWEVIDPTLEQARLFSRRRLDSACDAEALQPVEHDSKFWKGGFESAQGIKAVVDMSEFLGLTAVTLTDATDVEHSYSIAGAKSVAAAIGVAYQTFFMMRAAKRRDIADAETVAEALAVTWNDPS